MIKLFKSKKIKRVKPNTVSVSLIYNDKGNYTNIILSGNEKNVGKVKNEFLLVGDQTQLFYHIYSSVHEWLSDIREDGGFIK